ncbi:Uncharacterized protein family UPF0311 [Carpediemonas membranifera]|uniref:Uncharacterized protein family UPF0311 n=1 Tax=Carpediemonas membranifera TaxID=201153 RepID=A0A8J6AXY8_9EUKA|nr:Uncharacterized protein family UPF0311 [Carpediemonas membranifera]|eukprot:KAG9389989.1 Uncharacterized protein family UPF0311 [Carpediemonas membranifera]
MTMNTDETGVRWHRHYYRAFRPNSKNFSGENCREFGKRQLIPITGGTVSGAIEGYVVGGGVDSQVIDKNGICRLSARYAVETNDGLSFYIENNGIRRVPAEFRDRLFGDDMSFFNDIPADEVYFRTTPTFEVHHPGLQWLRESLFISSGERTASGVRLSFYRVT